MICWKRSCRHGLDSAAMHAHREHLHNLMRRRVPQFVNLLGGFGLLIVISFCFDDH